MDGATFVILSMGLTHGTLIAVGLRELWLLRRDRWRPEGQPEPEPTPPPPVDGFRKPLPDCLIPKPMARPRVREPELV